MSLPSNFNIIMPQIDDISQDDPGAVIVVHGGAWAVPDHLESASRQGVKTAARAGYQVLCDGGSAVDAVEAAVRVLEDDPAFDAGRGSVLTDTGVIDRK